MLAWNGLLSWWLSLVAFFVWLVVTTVLELRAVTAQESEELHQGTAEAVVDPVSATAPLVVARDPSIALEDRVDALSAELAAVRQDLARRSRLG